MKEFIFLMNFLSRTEQWVRPSATVLQFLHRFLIDDEKWFFASQTKTSTKDRGHKKKQEIMPTLKPGLHREKILALCLAEYESAFHYEILPHRRSMTKDIHYRINENVIS